MAKHPGCPTHSTSGGSPPKTPARRLKSSAAAGAAPAPSRLKNNVHTQSVPSSRSKIYTCASCAILFPRLSYNIPKKQKRVFCSRECVIDFNIKLKAKPCPQCGELFKPSEAARVNCSAECRRRAMIKDINTEQLQYLLKSGASVTDMARIFSVSKSCIWARLNRRRRRDGG